MIRLEEQLDRQRQIQAQREVYRGTDESKLFQEGILAAARRGAPDIVGPSKFQPTDYGKVTEAIKQLGEYLNYNDQSNWEVPATPSVPYTHRNIEMPTNVRNYDLLPQGDKFDYMDSIKDQSDWQTPKGVNWDAILDVFRTPKVEAYGYPDTPLRSQLDDMYAEQYGPMSKFRDTYGHDVINPIELTEESKLKAPPILSIEDAHKATHNMEHFKDGEGDYYLWNRAADGTMYRDKNGGNCTSWAFARALELGADPDKLIRGTNANDWINEAKKIPGVNVDNIPVPGSTVAWPKDSGYWGSLGHVGIVEKVYDDDSFDMSHSGSSIVARRGIRAAVDRIHYDHSKNTYYVIDGRGNWHLKGTSFIHFPFK
jgi:surface antigen